VRELPASATDREHGASVAHGSEASISGHVLAGIDLTFGVEEACDLKSVG
jgi:hypothetical protein